MVQQESEALITRYRPKTFKEVIGHQEEMEALQRELSSKSRPHAFLLTGPSGVGKTTIARIIGTAIKAEPLELDAASFSGIDSIKELMEQGRHVALSGAPAKMFIVDECHALSKAAWQAILKTLEEPPDHLYLSLCTTEFNKVPTTVKTRAYHLGLKALRPAEIETLLEDVIEKEGYEVNDDVFSFVRNAAEGSPRNALRILQKVHGCKDREEAKRIAPSEEASQELKELINYLLAGKSSWAQVQPMLLALDDEQIEHEAIGAARYIYGAMKRSKDERKAARAWSLLAALTYPSSTWDIRAAFYTAIGRMLWEGED